jgi:hypothetical protein
VIDLPPKEDVLEVESDGTIMKAAVRHSGNWGDGPALVLVFQLRDGRTTESISIPGMSQVDHFCSLLGARTIQELVGVSLRIVLLDDTAERPEVKEVLSHRHVVPDAFRRAFEDEDRSI